MQRTGHIYKRGKVFYVTVMIEGKVITRSLKTTLRREAEKAAAEFLRPFIAGDRVEVLKAISSRIQDGEEHLATIEADQNPPLTIEAAWLAYDKAGNRKEIGNATMRNYESYWTAFSSWMRDTHPKAVQLRQVAFPIAEQYWQHLQGRKVTGRTCNAHRAFLRAFWNVLKARADTDENPWAKLAKRDEHSISRRAFTVEELRTVCGSATGELRTLLAFGLYLGARLGDCALMEWGNVDMVRRVVRYVPRKTARKNPKPLEIPIHRELFQLLTETPPERRRGAVCPGLAEAYRTRGPDGVCDTVQKHFSACGLATTTERAGAGVRRAVSAGFHSLRHTAVTLLRNSGAAQSVSMALVGHSSPEIHAVYTHNDAAAMRTAVDQLPALSDAALPTHQDPLPTWARELLGTMTNRNWRQVKTKLLEEVTK